MEKKDGLPVPLKPALGKLRSSIAQLDKVPDVTISRILSEKTQVLARFQPIFAPEKVTSLTEEEFKDFLLFKNNKRWADLDKYGHFVCASMSKLRNALSILVDESRPIKDRLDTLIPKDGSPIVAHLGPSILTPILQVVYPDRYGVWNRISEPGMRAVNVWPTFDSRATFGKRYQQVNAVLVALAKELRIDLWLLDGLWWPIVHPVEDPDKPKVQSGQLLHEFLFDNWGKTALGKNWTIYEKYGDVLGYKFNISGLGQIDLLARHKREKKWLVIVLKKELSAESTVGKVLSYMGWVEKNLAKKTDKVEGLIISQAWDEKLRYALEFTSDIDVQLYEMEFQLYKVD